MHMRDAFREREPQTLIEVLQEAPDRLVVLLPPGERFWGSSLIFLAFAGLTLALGIVLFRRTTGAVRWLGLLFPGACAAFFLWGWAISTGLSYTYSFDRRLGMLAYDTMLFGVRLSVEDIPFRQIEPAFVQHCLTGAQRYCLGLITKSREVLLWYDDDRNDVLADEKLDGYYRVQDAINAFLDGR